MTHCGTSWRLFVPSPLEQTDRPAVWSRSQLGNEILRQAAAGPGRRNRSNLPQDRRGADGPVQLPTPTPAGKARSSVKSVLTAIHTLLYSDDPTTTRPFFSNVLRWPFVSEGARGDEGLGDTGGRDPADWLIFRAGPSELGVHPTSE